MTNPTPQTEIFFTPATAYKDGTPIPAGTALSYIAYIDTVNPPVKSYPVPAADVAAETGGIITSLFTSLGFKPVAGETYFADVTEATGTAVSDASNEATFTYPAIPAPPTLFGVR